MVQARYQLLPQVTGYCGQTPNNSHYLLSVQGYTNRRYLLFVQGYTIKKVYLLSVQGYTNDSPYMAVPQCHQT